MFSEANSYIFPGLLTIETGKASFAIKYVTAFIKFFCLTTTRTILGSFRSGLFKC